MCVICDKKKIALCHKLRVYVQGNVEENAPLQCNGLCGRVFRSSVSRPATTKESDDRREYLQGQTHYPLLLLPALTLVIFPPCIFVPADGTFVNVPTRTWTQRVHRRYEVEKDARLPLNASWYLLYESPLRL